MRWKALQFLGKLDSSEKQTLGFRSRNCPPAVEELANFEDDLMLMTKNVEFKNINNTFQEKLKNDIKELRENDKVFASADKSLNIYKMEKDEYKKLLFENVTKTYKKTTEEKLKTINKGAKTIAQKLELDDRVEKMQESQCYITVKDHKEDFPHKISCRLLNPSKSDIGKISKMIIDKINKLLVVSTQFNQWENTHSVIDWYINIRSKRNATFVVFDIERFYPSIPSDLFHKAIRFASEKCEITEDNMNIIMQSRKTLLFHENEPWTKKEGEEEFDVPMDCYDGAEVCEIVGCFMLNELSSVIKKNLAGLYGDDGLGILKNLSGPDIERKRKEIIKVFKNCGLNITIKTSLTSVDFLDVRFNLKDNTYEPYRKPNSDPIYINKQSNHPPNIIRDIPKAISKRLPDISCNKSMFDKTVHVYEKALKNSGFNEKISYIEKDEPSEQHRNNKKKRKRNIIWFNPPYSVNVKTNIGKMFFKIIKKNFPKNHQFYKILNRNAVRLSYSL